MISPFARYFFHHMVFSRERGRLLLLGLGGLAISSFALLALQGAMGGLQNNLVGRSKRILGSAVFVFHDGVAPKRALLGLQEMARGLGVTALAEYELELLVKHGSSLRPAVAHGVFPGEGRPLFLEDYPLADIIVPRGLSLELGLAKGDRALLISPAHTDSFMEDVPRSVGARVSAIFTTRVPELDEHHLWARAALMHNLVKSTQVNTLRLWGPDDGLRALRSLLEKAPWKSLGHYRSWEQSHPGLVGALALERRVMVALFGAMALLVSLCITGGLAIFFDRAKNDLAAFWALGAPEQALRRGAALFLLAVSVMAVGLGTALGGAFLWAFDAYAPELLPRIFVDRKIPVDLTGADILLSLSVPLGIALVFGHIALGQLNRRLREGQHLRLIRSLGQ